MARTRNGFENRVRSLQKSMLDHETLRLFETPSRIYYAGFQTIAHRVSQSQSLTTKFLSDFANPVFRYTVIPLYRHASRKSASFMLPTVGC